MSRGKTIDAFGARSKAREAMRPEPLMKVRDTHEERAEKAERIAHAQHATSLLGRDNPAARGGGAIAVRDMATARGVEAPKPGGMPFMLQVLMVMVLAGAAAFGISIYAPELMYTVL